MSTLFDNIVKSTPNSVKTYTSISLDIAERIAELLREKGISQKELADRLNKKESEISKWLTGLHNFTIKSLCKIEDVLGEKILFIPVKETKELQTKAEQIKVRTQKINKDHFTCLNFKSTSYFPRRDAIWDVRKLTKKDSQEVMKKEKLKMLEL